MMDTIETWLYRVRSSLHGYTEPEMTAIAQNCYVAQREGKNPAVWHHAAAFKGHKCQCAPCCAARKIQG